MEFRLVLSQIPGVATAKIGATKRPPGGASTPSIPGASPTDRSRLVPSLPPQHPERDHFVNPPCPFCGLAGGFHDEDIHDAHYALISDHLRLPTEGAPKSCNACGEPLNGPGEPGCRYPNHSRAAA